MAPTSRASAVIDTNVLLNFIAVDRAGLLARHPTYRFIITDHVRGEITERRPDRFTCFEKAMEDKILDLVAVSAPTELHVFGKLMAEGRLDAGQSAAAAHAIVRSYPIANDDRRARKILARFHSGLVIIDTVSIVRDFVAGGVLSVDEANALKADWEANHYVKLSFPSF